ncbi:MAG: hypothetical protein ACKOAQ_04645, partial [Acidimicrobiaceae bacterium]
MSDSRSSRLVAFDAWFDRLLEPTRNFKPTIWLFTAATALGDFGILWHIVGVVRAFADTSRVKQALILSALMGVESLLLNQGIKPFFKRERPTVKGDSRFKIRKPRTSSFP